MARPYKRMQSPRNPLVAEFGKLTARLLPLLMLALLLPVCQQQSVQALEERISVPVWRELPAPEYLWPGDGAIYYSFTASGRTRVHLVVVDVNSGRWSLRPAINEVNGPTSICAENNTASAATNGGYFNLSDGASASYVVIHGKIVTDPSTNKALIENPKLKPYIKTILDRSELRVLSDRQGKISVGIAPHSAPIPEGFKLVHSLQAGPRLLPSITSKEEAFVRTDPDGTTVDGIGSMKPAARTALGITPDGYVMLVCASGAKQDPESHGLTLPQLADLMKSLGCSEALNLDGGASTSMFIRSLLSAAPAAAAPPGRIVCGKTPETHVKSVLLVEYSATPTTK